MAISRPKVGDLLAFLGGAALLAVMFASWYGAGVSVKRAGFTISATTGVDAWHAFSVIDLVLLVLAVGAMVLATLRVTGVLSSSIAPAAIGAIGLVAAALILYRIISAPDLASQVPEIIRSGLPLQVTRRVGIFLGLAAALVVVLGALAMVSSATGGARAEQAPSET